MINSDLDHNILNTCIKPYALTSLFYSCFTLVEFELFLYIQCMFCQKIALEANVICGMYPT